MSESTTEYTCAGMQISAKRPPLTAESRLRMVLISRMSAPQESSWSVMFSSSQRGTSGLSNSDDPPPETRNSTVSPAGEAAHHLHGARRRPARVFIRDRVPGFPHLHAREFAFDMAILGDHNALYNLFPQVIAGCRAICQAALPIATR